MGTTEVESFVAVANMFLGQTDSPILVSKYIGNLTDSEILVILVSGMEEAVLIYMEAIRNLLAI